MTRCRDLKMGTRLTTRPSGRVIPEDRTISPDDVSPPRASASPTPSSARRSLLARLLALLRRAFGRRRKTKPKGNPNIYPLY